MTDAYYKLILEKNCSILLWNKAGLSERYLKQTEVFVELGLKSASDFTGGKHAGGSIYRISRAEIAVGSLYYI